MSRAQILELTSVAAEARILRGAPAAVADRKIGNASATLAETSACFGGLSIFAAKPDQQAGMFAPSPRRGSVSAKFLQGAFAGTQARHFAWPGHLGRNTDVNDCSPACRNSPSVGWPLWHITRSRLQASLQHPGMQAFPIQGFAVGDDTSPSRIRTSPTIVEKPAPGSLFTSISFMACQTGPPLCQQEILSGSRCRAATAIRVFPVSWSVTVQ